jgi:ABC-type polysaccharide/polyol phosphate transport system ATPase subunit
MTDTLVKVDNVSKKFCRSLKRSLWYGIQDLGSELVGRRHGGNGDLRPDEFWALKDISFELKRGECLGLIGSNGAGKTTLLRMLNGLIKPDAGRIEMRGRVGALIALGAGFNPILTGRENIYINAAVLGLSKWDTDKKFDEIVDFAELGDFIDTPVQTYSSGMLVRLGFAIATSIRPPVLILDEVLAVGDASFRDKCYQRIGDLIDDTAVVLVSHDANAIHRLAASALLLQKGKSVEYGPTDGVLATYASLHPTKALSPRVTISPWIEDFEICASPEEFEIDEGETLINLTLEVSFFSKLDTKVVQALGNITGNAGAGPIAGQFDLLPAFRRIHRGQNTIAVSLPRLSLAKGSYTCTLVVFGGKGNDLAFSARDFCFFESSGNVRSGAMYAPHCQPFSRD